MSSENPRLLILGAHPDDAEFHAGGIAAVYRSMNRDVRMISVTDGSAGHQTMHGPKLAEIRRAEARAAGEVIGAEYHTWDFPDGFLQPTLDVRHRIIREVREYQPDLVLTHRTNDYHPDHRAVGQAVQDACYLLTVPAVVPEVEALRQDPVVAAMPDQFTRPCRLKADAILDMGEHFESVVQMLDQQTSQIYDWLPYNLQILDQVPSDPQQRVEWLSEWFGGILADRRSHFNREVSEAFGQSANRVRRIEAFEISEYASVPDLAALKVLFPTCRFTSI